MLDTENIPRFTSQFPRWDKQKILDLRAQYVSFDINQVETRYGYFESLP
jgi:hypothetical protein